MLKDPTNSANSDAFLAFLRANIGPDIDKAM